MNKFTAFKKSIDPLSKDLDFTIMELEESYSIDPSPELQVRLKNLKALAASLKKSKELLELDGH